MPELLPQACAECRERFPELLDESLGEADGRRAVEHLASCAGCRAALAAVREAAEAPDAAAAPGLDPGTREELLQLFRSWRAGRPGA